MCDARDAMTSAPLKVVLFTGEVGISGNEDKDDANVRRSRLFALCEGEIPECLLPMANRTVLAYQLQLFVDVGITDVIIVTHDWCVDKIGLHTQQFNATLNIDIVAVPKYFCAIDTLQQLRPKLTCSDFVVLNWDIIVEPILLHRMVDLHRLKNATATALFVEKKKAAAAAGGGKAPAKGKGAKDAFSFDSLKLPSRMFTPQVSHFVGLDGNRLLMFKPTTPTGAVDDKMVEAITVSKSLLRVYPRITIHGNNSLEDCTFYIFSSRLFTFIEDNEGDFMSKSIQRDLLPLLVRKQFTREEADESDVAELDETDLLIDKMTDRSVQDCAQCYAFVIGSSRGREQGYIGRVQSLQSYVDVNRDIVEGTCRAFTPSEEYVESGKYFLGKGVSVAEGAQVGAHSVIGEGTTIGSGALVMKSVIGRGCKIGDGVKITNSVLMDHCVVHAAAPASAGEKKRPAAVKVHNSILSSHVEVSTLTVSQSVVGHGVKVSEELNDSVLLQ